MSRHTQVHTTHMLSTNIGDKMGASKINGFNAILIISLLSLVVNVSAETTFFDNPDDAFIMDDFATGGIVILGTTTGRVTGGSCTYEWNCTNWSECGPSGKQTRDCTNIGTCYDTYESPEKEQDCNYTVSQKIEEEKVEVETEKEIETEKINEKETAEKNKELLYFFIILTVSIIGFVIFFRRKIYSLIIFKEKKKRWLFFKRKRWL